MPNPITFNDFLLKAQRTLFDSRAIIVDNVQKAQSVKRGNLIFSNSQSTNEATMKAFKNALQQEYGVFGIHAFDTIVGTRAQLHKNLRARDIKAVQSQLETLKMQRFGNEIERQLETSPAVMQLTKEALEWVKLTVHAQWEARANDVKKCKTPEAISKLVNTIIMMAIKNTSTNPDVPKVNAGDITPLQQGEKQIAPNAPMGLSQLDTKTTYRKDSTSVEDHVRSGWAGAGMRVNFGKTSRPAIFEKLKTNGVEPGFIFHNDWSRNDTRALVIDIHSDEIKNEIDKIIKDILKYSSDKSDKEKEEIAKKSYLEKGLLIGRVHRAGVAFAAEYVLSKELDKLAQNPQPDTPLLNAIKKQFGQDVQKTDFFPANGAQPQGAQLANLQRLKKDCFVQLRDAVMAYGKTAAATDPNAKLPVFRHFTDRHILKLDYNESDRVNTDGPASAGQFRLPQRVGIKGGSIKGHFYRKFRLTTADKASVGAVSEAFANDLTRILGVPAQELTLVRGEYSDGHPKIMLEAKFAEGYKDLEKGFIKDGRIKANVKVEPLGKYKALFLALADRDAIGSHGQNKGVVNGKFFAIDPGHSLEGNGRFLNIKDNLSFTDSGGGVFEKRFRNYSVFDDDTRFNKMQGVLKLRDLRDSGAVERLFNDYKKAFNPQARGISPAEKAICEEITTNLTNMRNEFIAQIDKILNVCDDQLKLYDALDANQDTKALQEGAIETIENLEKFTSPTTWKSENGEVELKHLSVIESTRIPWTAKKVGDRLVYTSQKPIPQDRKFNLQAWTTTVPQSRIAFDPQGKATITVPLNKAKELFNAFSEEEVIRLTHLEEAAERERRAEVEDN